jgi:hypothetical protein
VGAQLEQAAVTTVTERRDLKAVVAPGVVAALWRPPEPLGWIEELAAAVETGHLAIERVVAPGMTREELALWGSEAISPRAVGRDTRSALLDDLLELADLVTDLTRSPRFMLRAFTEPPGRRCGFHVDTTPPGAPVFGVLRAYNGPGPHYVEPREVTSMRDFYAYLGRRERLGRRLGAVGGAEREVARLDAQPPFLAAGAPIERVPAAAVVAFRHVPVSLHWSDHARDAAWIHRSPSRGPRRLVVNLSPGVRR